MIVPASEPTTGSSSVTPTSSSDPSDEAHELSRRIEHSLALMRREWAALAGYLYDFVETRAWVALGYDSLREYLAQPEVDVGERYVYQLIEAHRTLVVERQVAPERLADVEMTKVRAVIPAIRRGEVEVEEALADAQVMSRVDLERRYRNPGAPIDPAREPVWETCAHCGSRYPVKARG